MYDSAYQTRCGDWEIVAGKKEHSLFLSKLLFISPLLESEITSRLL